MESVTPIEPKPEITPGQAIGHYMMENGLDEEIFPEATLEEMGQAAVLASRSLVSEEKAREVAEKILEHVVMREVHPLMEYEAALDFELVVKLLRESFSVTNGISEEKARAMEDALRGCLNWLQPSVGGIKAMNKATNALALPSSSVTQAPGWVSVKDRLPDVGVDVLLLDRSVGQIVGQLVKRDLGSLNRDAWEVYGGRTFTGPSNPNNPVTHWMPLPAPPVIKGE